MKADAKGRGGLASSEIAAILSGLKPRFLEGLEPDGSGKVVGKDDKNREFYLTFDPGTGARPFHVTNSINPCRRVYTPKT